MYRSMPRLLFSILIFILSAPIATAAGKPENTLCRPDEQVFFSCRLQQGKKIVSLCGSTGLKAQQGYLKYRFGVPGKLELEFPASSKDTQKRFRYVHYARYKVERTAVTFDNNGYRYTVFDSYEGDIQPESNQQGIEIERPGSKQQPRLLACGETALGNIRLLSTILACDPDNPLNMGECR